MHEMLQIRFASFHSEQMDAKNSLLVLVPTDAVSSSSSLCIQLPPSILARGVESHACIQLISCSNISNPSLRFLFLLACTFSLLSLRSFRVMIHNVFSRPRSGIEM